MDVLNGMAIMVNGLQGNQLEIVERSILRRLPSLKYLNLQDNKEETFEDSFLNEDDDPSSQWDDASIIEFSFLKTGRSTGDGILITHGDNYKVTSNV